MNDVTIGDIVGVATSLGPDALFEVEQGGVSQQVDWETMRRQFVTDVGPAINVQDFGAGTGDATIDTAAILAAWTAGAAYTGAPHLYFPPGLYYFDNATLPMATSNSRLFGEAATIVFKRSGQWKWQSTAAKAHVRGLTFMVDTSSSVTAPIWLSDASRTFFEGCTWRDVKTSAIQHNTGVLWLRQCDTDMVAGGGSSVIATNLATGVHAAVFVEGGRFNSDDHAAKILLDHSGAGTLDGCVLFDVNAASLDGAVKSAPASGGKLSNCLVVGGLFDQVDQAAFSFVPANGAILGDVTIIGAKVNGWTGSSATSGALVSIDLTSGATQDVDQAVSVTDCRLVGARVRALECKGGTLSSLIFSRNTLTDYGRQLAVGSRGIYIAGSFNYLEVADNVGITSRTHDYDIEFGAVTATKRKIGHNVFSGASPANLATYNQAAFDLLTVRPILTGSLDLYVNPSTGSDTNAGRVIGSPFATRQKAWDVAAAHDLNGQAVVIHQANGTYTAPLIATKVPLGAGSITFDGNSGTPSNVLVSTTSANCYHFPSSMTATVTIQNQKLSTTTSGLGVQVVARVLVNMGVGIEYGAIVNQHLLANGPAAEIIETGDATISGNFGAHAAAINRGRVDMRDRTHTIVGALACGGQYALCNRGGLVNASNMTFAGAGSVTGQRYNCSREGIIDTGTDTGSGATATYFPGNSAGVSSPGGRYY